MADTNLKGFPDVWGQHSIPLIDHKGPKSYAQPGELISTGGEWPRSFAFVIGGLDYSGTWRVDCGYLNSGLRSQVRLKWIVAATGQEVANGVNLSGATVRLLVVGG